MPWPGSALVEAGSSPAVRGMSRATRLRTEITNAPSSFLMRRVTWGGSASAAPRMALSSRLQNRVTSSAFRSGKRARSHRSKFSSTPLRAACRYSLLRTASSRGLWVSTTAVPAATALDTLAR